MANLDWNNLGFNYRKVNAVIVSYCKDGKWSPLQKDTADNISLNAFAGVYHYATSCFEGLKVFRGKDGKVRIFRPDENAKRMVRAADYLNIPAPSEEMFIEACRQCVEANIEFLPPYGHNASLYVRPLLMGVNPQLALVPPTECLFAVMCMPVGSYAGRQSLASVKAVISRNYDRAAPNGSGCYKVSSNYPCSFRPYKIIHDQGYTEMLFLNPSTKENIDEFGSSNFIAIKGDTFITPLSDSVLPSITNKTLQVIAADMGLKVEKRVIPAEELAEVDEVAAVGTAVVTTPICSIDDKPSLESTEVTKHYEYQKEGEVGPVCEKLYKALTGIQFGEIPDTHGWCMVLENL